MKLKLISDGTSWGTRIVNAETGEEVENVTRILVDISWGRVAVDMTLVNMETGVEFTVQNDAQVRYSVPVSSALTYKEAKP